MRTLVRILKQGVCVCVSVSVCARVFVYWKC
jgi:hypothetical protein